MTSVSTPVIGFSARSSETNVTPERQRLHSESGEGHDCRSRGTEASKEEVDTTNNDRVQHRVHFWSGIQCDDQLGDASTQRNLDANITSCSSRSLVVGASLSGASFKRKG